MAAASVLHQLRTPDGLTLTVEEAGAGLPLIFAHGLTVQDAIWPQDHLSFPRKVIRAEANPDTEIVAQVTLPFVEPEIGRVISSHFAAIHSNPPALTPTDHPSIPNLEKVITSISDKYVEFAVSPFDGLTMFLCDTEADT